MKVGIDRADGDINTVGDPGLPGSPVRLALDRAERILHRPGGEISQEREPEVIHVVDRGKKTNEEADRQRYVGWRIG